jgi:hypothetical protein
VNRLTVGGATVTVAAEGRGRWQASRLARRFSREAGSPRLEITVAPLAEAPPEGGRVAYDSEIGWWISERDDGWTIGFWDDHVSAARQRCLVLAVDRTWSRGTLHLAPPLTGAGQRPFRLWHPLEQILFTTLLGHAHGAVVHASAIVHGGLGWVFAGTHGAGKSTTAALFAGRDDAVVLSDDRVVVRRVEDGWRVFGTPWAGTVMEASPTSAPLAGIFFLRHGDRTTPIPLAPERAAPRLLARCFHPYWDRGALSGLLDTVSAAALAVPCHDFPFVPEAAAILAALSSAQGAVV